MTESTVVRSDLVTPRRLRRGSAALVGALLVLAAVVATAEPDGTASAAVTSPVPSRVLDTRSGVGGSSGVVGPGRTIKLTLPAAANAGATAVALNVTATGAARRGHVIAWPCDEVKPSTSVLNFVPGRSVANLVMIRRASSGVCLTSSQSVHLVVDLMSWFTGTGDFRGTTPNRIVDTRNTGNPLRARTVRRIRVAGTSGIPVGAAGAALNITIVAPAKNGYVTAFPCNASGTPPNSSTMNFGAGQTVAALSVSALADRDVCVYAHVDAHLVVDAYGWIPGGGDLRVKPPARVLDTRSRLGAAGAAGTGQTVRLRVAGRGGVPNTAEAALLTLTGANATDLGFVTAWPCDAPMPVASVLNLAAGSSRANLALVKLSASGEVCLRVQMRNRSALHLVADAVGWVPGSVNRPPPPTEVTRFATLPVGAALPSGAQCAARVRPAAERRPGNDTANHTRGTRANGRYPRVDGNFVGTTDEILQWVACKWGIDEDVVRAQAARESWWHQSTKGDLTSDQNNCHPELRTGSGQCPESIGLLQVRYQYHLEAFQDANAIRSSAYNADYAYAVWRSCFEGKETWLNNVERGATYVAGDLEGCLGVWFSGRYRTPAAVGYIGRVNDYLARRIWETPEFAFG
jgi:autotransporter family porin